MERNEVINDIKSRPNVIIDKESYYFATYVLDEVMMVGVGCNDIFVWQASYNEKSYEKWNSGLSVGKWSFKEYSHELLSEVLQKVKDGYIRCEHCGKWIPKDGGMTSGFTGKVCKDCANYAKPIDTWGD